MTLSICAFVLVCAAFVGRARQGQFCSKFGIAILRVKNILILSFTSICGYKLSRLLLFIFYFYFFKDNLKFDIILTYDVYHFMMIVLYY